MSAQQEIREANLKRIFRIILTEKSVSRAQIAHKTKLTKTTVSSLVEELLDRHFVEERIDSTAPNKIGRKPIQIIPDSSRSAIIVISWRSRSVLCTILSISSSILFEQTLPYSEKEDGSALLISYCNNTLIPFTKDRNLNLLGICIIVPAIVNRTQKKIHSTVLHFPNNKLSAHILSEKIPFHPLTILNDTACLGYAELLNSRLQKQNFSYVNLNSGVGAVFFEKGKMLGGAGAMATQFGHLSIYRDGRQCPCGGRGCLEQEIGEMNLTKKAAQFGIHPTKKQPITFAYIGKLVAEQHKAAQDLVRCLAKDLAYGLSNLIALCNPQLIILGGSGVKLGETYLKNITEELHMIGFKEFVSKVQIKFSTLGDSAETLGASRYFMDEYFTFTRDMSSALYLG
jgi:ROK family protein